MTNHISSELATKPTHWDSFFWELHERYFSRILYEFETNVKNAGDPAYYLEMFAVTATLDVNLKSQNDFTKELIAMFEHVYKLNKTNFITLLLNIYPEFRERHLKNEEENQIWHKPEKVEREYDSLVDRILFKPKVTKYQISVPIISSNPLIYETDPRKVVKFLVKYYTVEKLEKYFRKESEQTEDKQLEITEPFHLQWNGDNKTEFIQFAYALFHSGLATNSKQQITEFVPELAKALNFNLGKSWQSNLSKTKKRNNDYEPEIFDKLKNAYKNYVEERENK